jgi:hypothetical protein
MAELLDHPLDALTERIAGVLKDLVPYQWAGDG